MAKYTYLPTYLVHILLNILQTKGNQTTKPGQLIEHGQRNILFQKICRK